jgi:tight adherence protein C
MDDQTLLILSICGVGALIAFFGIKMLFRGSGDKLRERLAGPDSAKSAAPDEATGVKRMMERVGQAAAKPFMPTSSEKQSKIKQTLATAGIYDPSATRMVSGFKAICLVVGFVGGYFAGAAMDSTFLGLSVGGIAGYLLPTLWLRFKVKANQNSLTYGLADALDLMVVCVEAGLTVDAAMQRVGTELAIAHPAVSREFGITHMETRVGLSRGESLKNLGKRTGNAALQSLVSMLIQADRFGTSIANALRVHSETLRITRHRAAEESAAKASVKMTFPLVLFIFPATFIVMVGPTVIKFMESDLMK